MLLAPRALAITVTRPVFPAEQVVKVVSQCPAHATPLGATFRIEVSLEVKVMGVLMLVPVVVWAEATKFRVAPRVNEALVEGVRLMRPGKIGGPGLLLPHPAKPHKPRIATANCRPREQNLPMHPSLAVSDSHRVQRRGRNIE